MLAIPGLLICAAVCSLAGWFAGVAGMLLALATLLLLIVFYFLLPAPTQDGRNLLDHIAGLRMYLGVAERQDLERMQRPQLNAREFERFLPYALALDVAKTWTDRFAAAVGPAAAAAAGRLDGVVSGLRHVVRHQRYLDVQRQPRFLAQRRDFVVHVCAGQFVGKQRQRQQR